ncbi:1-hydroxycarotenoid 3,4-desaturase CrtD [Hyphomonas sp.]|uniref:1-hydroxycarotenoid 3,4-desaturase CrtD n=1 Tax=Hyphomonas sp. TaxID=87 RepID=UPI00391CBDF5
MSRTPHILIIGAGSGGLAAACDLAGAGLQVTVLERAAQEGGKMRQVDAGGAMVDAGPTVFTMRWVFDSLFAARGADFGREVALTPATVLARHAWTSGGALDLNADPDVSAEAIRNFAGPGEADAFRKFMAECCDIHNTLRPAFMAAQKPSPPELMLRVGNMQAMLRTRPFDTFGKRLETHFKDPRLRQLFGRYATYVGSSPFLAPATLMLIAHVEQDGVWIPADGMKSVAMAMRRLAETSGAGFRMNAHVQEIRIRNGRAAGVLLSSGEEIAADAVVFNGDAGALADGVLGEGAHRAVKPVDLRDRSLSAITWCVRARTSGLPLSYHNVFFAEDYPREFNSIFRERTIPATPTVYVCAQDRQNNVLPDGPERLLILINAPPDGDLPQPAHPLTESAAALALEVLRKCGVGIEGGLPGAAATTPAGFHALFPGTGGALYGRANHSAFASFSRPGAASRIPGLYLAGGSAHPGAGVPMAALSGRLAAARLLADFGIADQTLRIS